MVTQNCIDKLHVKVCDCGARIGGKVTKALTYGEDAEGLLGKQKMLYVYGRVLARQDPECEEKYNEYTYVTDGNGNIITGSGSQFLVYSKKQEKARTVSNMCLNEEDLEKIRHRVDNICKNC